MIRVEDMIDKEGLRYGANLPMHYDDLVHFFGKPMTVVGQDRTYEWYVIEERKGEESIRAVIYDYNDDNFNHRIDCHCDRSFEIVAEFIQQEKEKGKDFVTEALQGQGNMSAEHELEIDKEDEQPN